MLKGPLDDSSGLCDLIKSDNINIYTLLSIVVMATVSSPSATLKILILCDGSIKFKLIISSYIAVKLQFVTSVGWSRGGGGYSP